MVSTAHSYAALSRRLDALVPLAESWVTGFCGYSKTAVASRFLQCCTDLSVFQYTKISAEQFHATGTFPSDHGTVDCEGIQFVSSLGIRISAGRFVRALFEYCAHWVHALSAICLSLRWSERSSRCSLLYGVGVADLMAGGSDARFLEFCRNGSVSPLVTFDRLVVQAAQPIAGSSPSQVRYGRFPLFLAIRWRGLRVGAWLYAVWRHLVATRSFVHAVLRFPGLILLGRDAAYHAIAEALNRVEGLQDVILTNSNYFSQALWMWALPGRKHRLHLAWYSQNNYPLAYADDPVFAPIPNLRFINADIQWVWTSSFMRFLQAQGCDSDMRVIGPIVWHLPGGSVKKSPDRFRIAVFDVTPVDMETEHRLGLIRNYYTEQTMTQFLTDIITVSQRLAGEVGRKIDIVLKHKRVHAPIHGKGYLRVVRDFEQSDLIKTVPPAANLFDLIDGCDAVIAVPFSSPAYVGLARQRTAAWYDCTHELLPMKDVDGICQVFGCDALEAFLRRACEEKAYAS